MIWVEMKFSWRYLPEPGYCREGNVFSGNRCGIEEPKVFQEKKSEDSSGG
jgi:hypothetical protein